MTKKHLFTRPKTCLPHEIAQRYLFGVPSVAKNLSYQRNPWLVKDLRDSNALYNCKETFTDVMKTLQIKLFMQNKAKSQKVKLNVTKVLTRGYDLMDTWLSGKKQSQTNPNKAKFKKAKMNVTTIITKAYENISPIQAPKKQSQTLKRQKPMQTSLPKGIMKITAISCPYKTKPNKPNQSQSQKGQNERNFYFNSGL